MSDGPANPDSAAPQRILITVSGPDRPGITAVLTGIMADGGVEIADIEQVVVQGLLSLSLVLEFRGSHSREQPVVKDLLFAAKELGLELDFKVLAPVLPTDRPQRVRHVLSLIGSPELRTRAVARVAKELAAGQFNIETIQRLNQGTLQCLEMTVSSAEDAMSSTLQAALAPVGREEGMDIAVQPDTVFRMMKRLIIFDLDSTLIQAEVIDELAREAQVYDQVCGITERAMNGEMDFAEALLQRVAALRGLSTAQLDQVYGRLQLTSGAERLIHTLQHLGYRTGIISGGFTYFTERLRARLGMDYAYANELEIVAGRLTGRLLGPLVDGAAKARLLEETARREGIRLEQVIAIGDGANDLPMLQKAGLGIAFNAKPTVREAARHALNQHRLDAILFLLGLNQDDVSGLAPGA